MKKWIFASLILIIIYLLAGCADQVRFSDEYMWSNASVVNTSDSDNYQMYEVRYGDDAVFCLSWGCSHGRWTTAHASHDNVYLILNKEPEEGSTYTLAFEEQTLKYDGHHGYWFWMIDDTCPAKAMMTVKKITNRHIDADVDVHFTAIVERRKQIEGVDRTFPIDIEKKCRFIRETMKDEQ